MSETDAKLAGEYTDREIADAAKATNNPWVALFTGILLKHGIYAVAFVSIGYMYMEKDKSYQQSRDQELDRYINVIQRSATATERNTVVTERLVDYLERNNFGPPGAR